jgi:outer membrane protein assembly factor BamB
VAGPFFLVVSDSGIASCFNAEDGNRLWMERLGGGHSASAVSAGGLVYFVSDKGITTVVRPGPKFEVVAKNEIKELVSSSPAISQGQIFIRGQKHLFCIGKKAD